MAASAPARDYVHVLAAGIDARTGGRLRISATDPSEPSPDGSIVTGAANVVNIADI
jgi:hypothetical protein